MSTKRLWAREMEAMNCTVGVKSDPVEYRYSFDWLFDLCAEHGVPEIQLGSFFELYFVDDAWLASLRAKAECRGLRIKSCFTAHRELGGFFTGDRALEKVARRCYERAIHVGSVLGADFVGSNPGAVYRDRPHDKGAGIECYLANMRELMHLACEKGLRGLTIEPMSSLFEPPSLPEEIDAMMNALAAYHRANRFSTAPVYLCGDISHGLVDREERVICDNYELFETSIPYMAEFHFKNTDSLFNATFGFSSRERMRGVVDLHRFYDIIESHDGLFPVADLTGYLEIGGPKTGRDYSDWKLGQALSDSIKAIRTVFDEREPDRIVSERYAAAP